MNEVFDLKLFNVFTGGESQIVKKMAMEDDPQRRKPDIGRALKYLGWTPKVRKRLFIFNLIFSVQMNTLRNL